MIDIAGLEVRRGDTEVFSGLTMRVAKGEMVRLTGPNGCGKSTLLSVLAGLRVPSSGTVSIAGRLPQDPLVRGLRGFLQEPPPLYEYLTAREQLALVAGLWDVRTGALLERADVLGLTCRQDVLVGGLSLGQRKKLGYVCATAHDPQLLLLDEPFNGLDSAALTAVVDDLTRRKQEGGTTIVWVSHTDPDAGLADRTIDLGARDGSQVLATGDGE
ncbi:ABC transporter ATP-binding protein [Streptomyces sp. A3M-1-3]|uniref:ATP-binding cassette domain-containing protein n=1 Tax=Streptomyces sp. A3M-1-3 TaxID=2962044 RepID=UPI0020B8D546|nr:ABC transporter ATP-binding protein [Streptomyces sp. A3M-1-3]MCP3819413.1 ABC transporter ATP-binding protein [Streptomyces sp. A3M-1-3]